MADDAEPADPVGAAFDYHRRHPEISIDDHYQARAFDLGERVARRKTVYLDTRYWILLRDVQMGRGHEPVCRRLLDALRERVKAGRIVCPVSSDAFTEILSQTDMITRVATCELMDTLSDRTAIQPEAERVPTELLHCITRLYSGEASVRPLRRLVWTAPIYVLGCVFPVSEAFSPEEHLVMQKAYMDHVWTTGFAAPAKVLPSRHLPDRPWERLADKMNQWNEAHHGSARSFRQAHAQEFAGAIDFYLPQLEDILRYKYFKATGRDVAREDGQEAQASARRLGALLVKAFRRGKIGAKIPTLMVRSNLAAAVRWNRGRRYKANDFHDFGHARGGGASDHNGPADYGLVVDGRLLGIL